MKGASIQPPAVCEICGRELPEIRSPLMRVHRGECFRLRGLKFAAEKHRKEKMERYELRFDSVDKREPVEYVVETYHVLELARRIGNSDEPQDAMEV